MNESTLANLALGVICVGAIAFGVWLGMSIWDECRDAGHSVLYCMRMVSR